MRRRVIKVRGGYLNTDQYGDIKILSKAGTPITIRRVYYVLRLGANLISYRRLYTLGLIRAFNTKVLRLLKSSSFIYVLEAY